VIAVLLNGSTPQYYIVGKDSSNAIWLGTLVSNSFSGWHSLGGTATGKPAVIAPPTSGVTEAYVVIRDSSGATWAGAEVGTSFSGWVPAGGVIATDPQVGTAGGTVYSVGLNSFGAVWYNYFSAGDSSPFWHSWATPGGTLDASDQLWWLESPGRGWIPLGFGGLAAGLVNAAPH
jgi:hypothetical protein